MGKKHCEEKEKLLATSNFSFSHHVFKGVLLQTGKNQGLFGKRLIIFCPLVKTYVDFTSFPVINGSYFDYLNAWTEVLKSRPSRNILVIYYEDLVQVLLIVCDVCDQSHEKGPYGNYEKYLT